MNHIEAEIQREHMNQNFLDTHTENMNQKLHEPQQRRMN